MLAGAYGRWPLQGGCGRSAGLAGRTLTEAEAATAGLGSSRRAARASSSRRMKRSETAAGLARPDRRTGLCLALSCPARAGAQRQRSDSAAGRRYPPFMGAGSNRRQAETADETRVKSMIAPAGDGWAGHCRLWLPAPTTTITVSTTPPRPPSEDDYTTGADHWKSGCGPGIGGARTVERRKSGLLLGPPGRLDGRRSPEVLQTSGCRRRPPSSLSPSVTCGSDRHAGRHRYPEVIGGGCLRRRSSYRLSFQRG